MPPALEGCGVGSTLAHTALDEARSQLLTLRRSVPASQRISVTIQNTSIWWRSRSGQSSAILRSELCSLVSHFRPLVLALI
ncbi:MAG: hypothetical protein ABI068_07325 [Ktedonobacterales bacterium]